MLCDQTFLNIHLEFAWVEKKNKTSFWLQNVQSSNEKYNHLNVHRDETVPYNFFLHFFCMLCLTLEKKTRKKPVHRCWGDITPRETDGNRMYLA